MNLPEPGQDHAISGPPQYRKCHCSDCPILIHAVLAIAAGIIDAGGAQNGCSFWRPWKMGHFSTSVYSWAKSLFTLQMPSAMTRVWSR